MSTREIGCQKEQCSQWCRQQDYMDKLQQAQAQLARGQAEQEKAKLSFDRVGRPICDAERDQAGLRFRAKRSWPAPPLLSRARRRR